MRAFSALVVLFLAGPLRAQSDDAKSLRARDHFREGLSQVERGDLDAALREFEAAYAAQPHPSVLYNIAQAHLGLGQTLRAIESFERYLREAGEELSPERRREVARALDVSRSRLGQLALSVVEPTLTRVWLDGSELRSEAWARPISVIAGAHNLLYSVDGGSPTALTVEVARGNSTQVRIEATNLRPKARALLAIQCSIPGVEVEVNGVEKQVTPVATPIPVPPGSARVRFARPGYRTVERSVQLESSALSPLDCELAREPVLPLRVRAGLRVFPSPRDAQTLVDGELYFGGELPAGPHWVTTQRDGFIAITRSVDLSAGQTLHYSVELQHTPAARARLAKARSSQRWLGAGLSGLGVALLATAGGLFVWNNQRYRDWESNQASRSFARNLSSVVSLQRIDDLCIGLTVLGGAASASGTWLLLTPPKDVSP